MDSNSEIILELEPDVAVTDSEAPESAARVLPFSFAKKHGVLIRDAEDGVAQAVFRTGASPLSLAEARRFAGNAAKDDPCDCRGLRCIVAAIL